jgi:hypothetical protein
MMRTFPTFRGAVSAALLAVALGAGVATMAQPATAAVPAAPAGAQALPVTPVDNDNWLWPPVNGRGDGPRWHDDGRGGHWDRGRRAHGNDDDNWDDWRRRLRHAREQCEHRRPLTPWGEWDWDNGECRWRRH